MLNLFKKKKKEPNHDMLNHLDENGELPWGWIYANKDFLNKIENEYSYFLNSWCNALGKSPKEFLSEYRIKQACYLLTHNNMSMMDIAESVGFDNSLYFSRVFHKQMGMPPTEYARKNHVN